MKMKSYVRPETEVLEVRLENMLAASILVDDTPNDGLEGNSFQEGGAGLDIWKD